MADSTLCEVKQYETATLMDLINLSAPHTWAAAILPCLVGVCYSLFAGVAVEPLMTFILLAICVLLQSAANVFNDYFDFKKGTDSEEDLLEADDSILVTRRINPKVALAEAIVLVAVPFLLAIYVVMESGWAPLSIGAVGAIVTVLYSCGKTPISYLPLGEFVSGFVMGALIPLGVATVLLHRVTWEALIVAIPTFIAVWLIMQTNNTCDIEKDIEAKRRTLPVLMGRASSRKLYRILVLLWVLSIAVLQAAFFTASLWLLPFFALAAFGLLKPVFKNPLIPQSRIAAMGSICSANIGMGSFYCAVILASLL